MQVIIQFHTLYRGQSYYQANNSSGIQNRLSCKTWILFRANNSYPIEFSAITEMFTVDTTVCDARPIGTSCVFQGLFRMWFCGVVQYVTRNMYFLYELLLLLQLPPVTHRGSCCFKKKKIHCVHCNNYFMNYQKKRLIFMFSLSNFFLLSNILTDCFKINYY